MDSRICTLEMQNFTRAKTGFFHAAGTCESMALLKATPNPDSVSNHSKLSGLLSYMNGIVSLVCHLFFIWDEYNFFHASPWKKYTSRLLPRWGLIEPKWLRRDDCLAHEMGTKTGNGM